VAPGAQRPSAFATAEEIIVGRARREPHRGALGWRDRTILLGRLAGHVETRAEALAAMVAPGGAIAQVMSDTPGFVATTLAAWRHGSSAVPLDPSSSTAARTISGPVIMPPRMTWKPPSRSARATTEMPRQCPSRAVLASRMRGDASMLAEGPVRCDAALPKVPVER